MISAFDAMFYLLGISIVFLLAWRPVILKIIAWVSPELWVKLNEWGRPADYEATKARVAERKAKREKRKLKNSGGK